MDNAFPSRITEHTEPDYGRHLATGTLSIFSARLLILPAGLIAAVFLTRMLGPEKYGFFTVAATIVMWIEFSTTQIFSRTTVKFVAEASDWEMAASALVQAQFAVSLIVTGVLMAVAPLMAAWLRAPELTGDLRLFALDIPIFALAHAHRSVLTGRRHFSRTALLSAIRRISRLLFILLLVGLGFSITGAIIAGIGASICELIAARISVQPALLRWPAFSLKRFGAYAVPLFFYAIGFRLFQRVDILIVQRLSETPATAGFYGAAQNLTIIPTLFAASLSGTLLATLAASWQSGRQEEAQAFMRHALRLCLYIFPFAALASGAAPELVALIYGDAYTQAGPIFSLLIFANVGFVVITITTTILTAADRPGLTVVLVAPLIPLAVIGHLALVPFYGAIAAAAVTTALTWVGAIMTSLAVLRQCGVYPGIGTLMRLLGTGGIAYGLAVVWQAAGLWVVVELLTGVAVIVICLLALGEIKKQDVDYIQSLRRKQA